MIRFILNQTEISTALPAGTLLLDFIRYHQRLTGTKIGCREGDCGACTILSGEIKDEDLVYRAVTSCLMPLGNARGKHIVTVEGVNIEGLNLLQQSFANEGATQCGFCTPGFIVSLAGICLNKAEVTVESAIDSVNGNICRCTGYKSIERAAAVIAQTMCERKDQDTIDFAVEHKILPSYFTVIKERIAALDLSVNGFPGSTTAATKFLGGGTDLYVQQHDLMAEEEIDFLFNKDNLKGIWQHGNRCVMGASVTVADLLESTIFQQYFPSLKKYIKLVSSTQIRNMATIAGNIINASPIGDFTIFFLALDAQVIVTDGISTREIPLRKLYKGYKQLDKVPAEYIDKIYFELPHPGTKFNFEKVSKRTHLDIASVNTAISIKMDGEQISTASLSAGGVAPVPGFLEKSSTFLQGKKVSPALLEELIEIAQAEISPISDARGTAMYKRLLLGQLIKAHFVVLFPELEAKIYSNHR